MPRRLLAVLLAGSRRRSSPPCRPYRYRPRTRSPSRSACSARYSSGTSSCRRRHCRVRHVSPARVRRRGSARGRNPGVDKGTIDDVRGSPGYRDARPRGHPALDRVFGGPAAGHSASRAVQLRRAVGRRAVLGRPRALAVQRSRHGRDRDRARRRAREPGGRGARDVRAEMAKVDRTWADVDRTYRARDAARARDRTCRPTWPPCSRNTHLPAAVHGGVRRSRDHACPHRVRDRRIRAHARRRRNRVGSVRRGGLIRSDGPRALRLACAQQAFHCVACHTPPLFTNNEFFQIGVRRGTSIAAASSSRTTPRTPGR